MNAKEELIDRLSFRLLENIGRRLEEGELEIKDYKAVTGALRELRELGREEGPGAEKQSFTVRFVGETEEMSQ